MEFATEFALTADAETAWRALLDVPRMAPLMPGVVLDDTADAEHRGRVKIKFGATTITFKGTVRTAVVDDLTRTAILEATAREARGPGTAEATFQATVLPAPTGSRVLLNTRATLTGRAATIPAPLLTETCAKLLTRFAAALSTALTDAPTPLDPEPLDAPEAPDEPTTPVSESPDEPTDVPEPEVPDAPEPTRKAPDEPSASEPEPIPAAPEDLGPPAAPAAEDDGGKDPEPVEALFAEGIGALGAGPEERGTVLRRVLPVLAVVLAVVVVVRAVVRRRGN
ncbi:carbon monoxide dehydrogenase subunit G [Actinocorallia herbida]|uniref:Carbon monoxide dehydrogenase subunit G n=1 Tax=Actinocorallia herbida TaxID=58109 RepID=A0A3N1D9H5_9ACTN|nr:SRPBCC domain-containing protein [Actinocorallia herbida]ROO90185.1 carbon monoxide dehydrogenase subunit G [Actinocorallia herbida]